MRTFILTLVVIVSFVIFQSPPSHSNSNQPPIYNAGPDAGQSSCGGSNCHNTNELNSGSGSAIIELNNDILNYLPDSIYDVSLTIEHVGSKKFGFEMVAFDENANSVGTFFGNDSDHTATQTFDGIQFIHHKNAPSGNDSYTFNMKWQAPSEDMGTINFYACVNAADGVGSVNDFIYTSKFAFPSNTDTDIASFTIDEQVKIYPNPTNGFLNIESENENPGGLFLYNSGGQLLQTYTSYEIIDLSDFDSGIYFLKILMNDKYQIKKIIR